MPSLPFEGCKSIWHFIGSAIGGRKMWHKLQDASWQFFVSLRLTFALLFFIGTGAMIGMSYDQTLSFDEFQKNIATSSSGFGGVIANFFELYDVFHSWWFSLSILLLAANLI